MEALLQDLHCMEALLQDFQRFLLQCMQTPNCRKSSKQTHFLQCPASGPVGPVSVSVALLQPGCPKGSLT